MRILALLPMKGNSERVPNKNLRDFAGKPLYHRTMEVLLGSKYIDKVIVNTDSEVIKNDLKTFFNDRVIIINRPDEIIGDMVSMNKVIECDVTTEAADIYLQTHSTNPLLKTESVDAAIEKMFEFAKTGEYDSIFSVTKMQTRLYKADGSPFNHNPEELLRTQDLEPLFEENSNFYIFTKNSFFNAGEKRIGLKPFMFEIDKIEAVDIDEPEDFIIAESLYKLLR
ncbi:acylneuraminate cytidylyltransferase [Flavobacterium akiainvivens]|uniref:Acylneuraminate cytidylyltransferase n=2 Tax=Flavobacterium akiainvivens TaxID=1202724 RepID=A0A0M8M9J3_9FLAO|nr:acylneuraminate cytidylyltransferase family protein [Flavobacterium akiainvivens]KOS06373.1 acylneuraminate cytidylyltransferase [Flavobacterium akiainvivens]SFQ14921.1 CMP-N-acetylneuraminic acid synthetase [Flavobacterium akiainvivens]